VDVPSKAIALSLCALVPFALNRFIEPRSAFATLAPGADFHLDPEALPEVELSRPACHPDDDSCPWWLYGNTFGTPKKRTVGVVFNAESSGKISARMHCYNAGCDGADSMFADTSDNFNETGTFYCAAVHDNGFSPTGICEQVAPGAHVLHLGNAFPFEAGTYLAAGFKSGGDRAIATHVRVYGLRFIYEGPPAAYFGADTNVNPLAFPRDEELGFDFYAGRLGWGANLCKIDKNGWDILFLPKLKEVPNGKKCQFDIEVVEDMIAKLGPQLARQRTYAYWLLQGPRHHKNNPRQWGTDQARKLFVQVNRYRAWIDGRTLFADIEPPLVDASGDTWAICVEPGTGGTVRHPAACRRNRAVLEGFLQYVTGLKGLAQRFDEPSLYFEPGVYTRPEAWVTYFGFDWVPEVTVGQGKQRRRDPVPFVLWITGCASSKGAYDVQEAAQEAAEIVERQMLSIVQETTLGGSRSVLWQYHLEKPDFDVTLYSPTGGFTPVPASIPYYCSCSDPDLERPGAVGSCPALDNVLLETLTVPSDGSVVTTGRSYPSFKTFRIEVSGAYKWKDCEFLFCSGGGDCVGDAEYVTDNCWISQYDNLSGTDISLFLDGEDVNWGPFRSDHVYSILLNGKDGPFSFHINDCTSCYADNGGSLTVKIYEMSP